MLANKKVILLLCAVLGSGLAWSQGAADPEMWPAAADSEQLADAALLRMATDLAGAQRFQVDITASYDTVQSDGQKIEFGEKRQLFVERPSLLLSETHYSDGAVDYLLFDGERISISNTRQKVYARAPQPGDIDATLKYFLGGLNMRLPLAIMLMSSFPEEIENRVLEIALVEETDFLGEPAQHLAGRTRDVDFQIWISKGKRPVPLRVVLTYRQVPGQPQFRADFSNWKFNPSFLQRMFRFEPQPGARELPFAASFTVDTAAPEDATATTPPSTGEQP